MSDISNINKVTETPYHEWITNNQYDDPVQSLGVYTEHLKSQYADADALTPEVEDQLNTSLIRALQDKGLIDQENQKEVLPRAFTPFEIPFEELAESELDSRLDKSLKESDRYSLKSEYAGSLIDYFADSTSEEIKKEIKDKLTPVLKKRRSDKLKEQFMKKQIDAAVIYDDEGNASLLSRLTGDETPQSLIIKNRKHGVSFLDYNNIVNQRSMSEIAPVLTKSQVLEREHWLAEAAEFFETPQGEIASAHLDSISYNIGKEEDGRFDGLMRSVDRWKRANFVPLYIGLARRQEDSIDKDDILQEYYKKRKHDFNVESIADDNEDFESRLKVIDILTAELGMPEDVAQDVVAQLVTTNGAIKQHFKYDDEDLSKNVRKSRFRLPHVSEELLANTERYKKAIKGAGITGAYADLMESQRRLLLTARAPSIVETLQDSAYAEDWAQAIANQEEGDTIVDTIEKFASDEDNFSELAMRGRGVGASVWDSFQDLAGLGGLLVGQKEWAQGVFEKNILDRGHRRQVANVFGVNLGLGQDIAESIAPLFTDMVITTALAAATKPTVGTSLAVLSMYVTGKAGATAAARNLLKQGIRKTLTVSGTDTIESAATSLVKKGIISDRTMAMTALSTFNSQVTRKLGIVPAVFMPAASRSGASAYGSIFVTVKDDLTKKHFVNNKWAEGWSYERVADEAHKKALEGGFITGLTTGIITSAFSFAGRGSLEETLLKGVNWRQLKRMGARLTNRDVGDAVFKEALKKSVSQGLRKVWKESGRGIIKAGVDEAMEESIDGLASAMIEAAYTNQDMSVMDGFVAAYNGAIAGLVLGSFARVGREAVSSLAPDLTDRLFTDNVAQQRAERGILQEYEAVASSPEFAQRLADAGAPQTAAEARLQLAAMRRFAESSDITAQDNVSAELIEEAEEVSQQETEAEAEEFLDALNSADKKDIDREFEASKETHPTSGVVDPDIESDPHVEELLDGDDVREAAGNILKPHYAETNLDVHKNHEDIEVSIKAKVALYNQMASQAQSLEGDGFDRITAEIDEALQQGRVLRPEQGKARLKKEKKRYTRDIQELENRRNKGLSDNDKVMLDRLAERGYPQDLSPSQIEALDIKLDEADRISRMYYTEYLREKINEKFPVSKPFLPTGGVKVDSPIGESTVYIDEKGRGVFNNDPASMAYLLMRGVPVSVPQAVAVDPFLNPSFELEKRGASYHIKDIKIPESGGLKSVLTPLTETGVLAEDNTQFIKDHRAFKIAEKITPNFDLEIPNPFVGGAGKISVEDALLQAKDLSFMRTLVANKEEQLNKDHVDDAALHLSINLRTKLHMMGWDTSTEVNLTPLVSKVAETYLTQQRARARFSKRAAASAIDSDHPPKSPVGAYGQDDYTPIPVKIPIDISEAQLESYVEAQYENGIRALREPSVRKEVIRLLSGTREGVENYDASKLFNTLTEYLARGGNISEEGQLFSESLAESAQDPDRSSLYASLSLLGVTAQVAQGIHPTSLVKETLRSLTNKDSISTSEAEAVFKEVKKYTKRHYVKAVIDRRSKHVIRRDNYQQILDIGLQWFPAQQDPETVLTVLRNLVKGKDKTLAATAELLLTNPEYLKSIDIVIVDSDETWAGQFFTAESGQPTIYLNKARESGKGMGYTLLHELVHAFATRITDLPPAARSVPEANAIARLEGLRKILYKKSVLTKGGNQHNYALSSVDELIAVFLTDAKFQAFVKSMDSDPQQRSFFVRLMEAVTRLVLGSKESAQYQVALNDILDLTTRFQDTVPESGFKRYMSSHVRDALKRRRVLATSINLEQEAVDSERITANAEKYADLVVSIIPAEIGVIIDDTVDSIMEYDPNKNSIVFNSRRAALFIDANERIGGAELNATAILAVIVNEEVAHVSSYATLSKETIATLIEEMTVDEAVAIAEMYHTGTNRSQKIQETVEALRSDNPAVIREEKEALLEENLRMMAQKTVNGRTTEEHVALLLKNPSLLKLVKEYFLKFIPKFTTIRDRKHLSPTMVNAVDRIVTELRAANSNYRSVPNQIAFDPSNPTASLDILLEQINSLPVDPAEDPEWWEEGYVHTGKGADPRVSHEELRAKFEERYGDEEIPDNAWELFIEAEGVEPTYRTLPTSVGGKWEDYNVSTRTDITPIISTQSIVDEAMDKGTEALDSGITQKVGHEIAKLLEPPVEERIDWKKNWKPRGFKTIEDEQAFRDDASKAGDRMLGTLERALNEFPDFAKWYSTRVKMAMDIFEELDADIKKPEDNFMFRMLLAITSNGNKVKEQTEDSWDLYKNWKETGKVAPPSKYNPARIQETTTKTGKKKVTPVSWIRGSRQTTIKGHLALVDALIEKTSWQTVEKFFNKEGPRRELIEGLQETFGFTKKQAQDATTGELIDEVVPYSLFFGPKLGAFYQNLSQKFNFITMDLWFMRTWGRSTGSQLKHWSKGEVKEKTQRLQRALDKWFKEKDPNKLLFKTLGINRATKKVNTPVVLKLVKHYTVEDNRKATVTDGKWASFKGTMEIGDPIQDELRKAANAVEKVIDGGRERIEAPQGAGHRRFIRLAMFDALGKLEDKGVSLDPAEAQAILWYYEKAVHQEFGSGSESEAPDYGSAANEVYRSVSGTNAKAFRVSSSNRRRGDTRRSVDGDAGDAGRGLRTVRSGVGSDLDYGAASKIPRPLSGKVNLSNWLETINIPLLKVGGKGEDEVEGWWTTARKATGLMHKDARLAKLRNRRQAFVREAKKIVEQWHYQVTKETKQILKDNDAISEDDINELIGKASGSLTNVELTQSQLDAIGADLAEEVSFIELEFRGDIEGKKKALEASTAREKLKRKAALASNRKASIETRNEALKELYILSPTLGNVIVEMRELVDELSGVMKKLFPNNPDIEATFDNNLGLYITKRYRMFEDPAWREALKDDDNPEIEAIKDDAADFLFAQFESTELIKRQKKDPTLTEAEARREIRDELAEKGMDHKTKGRELVENYIQTRLEATRITDETLDQYTERDQTREILISSNNAGSELKAILHNLKQREDMPTELGALLGEYKTEAGATLLTNTILRQTSMMANQSLLQQMRDYGLEGDDPWLVPIEEASKDVTKYPASEWKTFSREKTSGAYLNPLHGYLVREDMHKIITQLFPDKVVDPSKLRSLMLVLRKATGLSLAAKTLGSTGFYLRNMVGNAFFFGPMQGYYGGIPDAISEVKGTVKSIYNLVEGFDDSGNRTQTVLAIKGAKAEIDEELLEIKSLNIYGDELEAELLRDILIGETSIKEVEGKLKSISRKIGKARGATFDKLVDMATRLASAMDAYYKIGYYKHEMGYLIEAAKAEGPEGEYGQLLDSDGNPTRALKELAAEKVLMTSQSYSQAPPMYESFKRSDLTIAIAPYVRFAIEVPRITYNTFGLGIKEMRSSNPVIKKRGSQRLAGATTVLGFFSGGLQGIFHMLTSLSDDEEEFVRSGLVDWMKDHTLFINKNDNGTYTLLDLTYLNPFSLVMDPVLRSFSAVKDGDWNAFFTSVMRGAFSPYAGEQILAGAFLQAQDNENDFGKKISTDQEDIMNKSTNWLWFVYEKAFEPRSFKAGRLILDEWSGDNPNKTDKALELFFNEFKAFRSYTISKENLLDNYLYHSTEDLRQVKYKLKPIAYKRSMNETDVHELYRKVDKLTRRRNAMDHKIMKAAINAGMLPSEVFQAFKDNGVGRKRVREIYNNTYANPDLNAEDRKNARRNRPERLKWFDDVRTKPSDNILE